MLKPLKVSSWQKFRFVVFLTKSDMNILLNGSESLATWQPLAIVLVWPRRGKTGESSSGFKTSGSRHHHVRVCLHVKLLYTLDKKKTDKNRKTVLSVVAAVHVHNIGKRATRLLLYSFFQQS